MGVVDRIKGLFTVTNGSEGSHRGPFFGMGELGNWHQYDPLGDGWQRNIGPGEAQRVPAVYACVMLIARAMAQCYPKHVRVVDGTFTEVKTSAAYRILNNPNTYQSSPDFLLNAMATALFDGEAFALATRNDRSEIDSLHLLPRGTCSPMVDDDTRQVFYAVGASPLAPGGTDFIAPARDVLHLRFHTPRHPLIGESPIKSAALAIGINVALSETQNLFFRNMNRPSGVISTDQVLNKDQIASLRAAFEAQAEGMSKGKIPILGGGLKFQQLSVSSQDAQLVQAQRMSLEDICRVFGVPPPLVGDLSHATLNNAESMMQHFLSMSLGSYLEHFERSFDRLFGLKGDDYIELDTAALLRTDFSGRIDGLTKAVQGGLMTPTEARAREGLGPIGGGDSAFLQRQMVPIDRIGALLDREAERDNTSVPPPPEAPARQPDQAPIEDGKSLFQGDLARAMVENRIFKANIA